MDKILIASNNAGKIREISDMLSGFGWSFTSMSEAGVDCDPIEDADTYLGNAEIKAREIHALTGMPVIADDSGLEVDAIGGAPGVFSARYAGSGHDDAANNEKLLNALSGVPVEKRTARYVCTLVFIDANGHEVSASGSVEGTIGTQESGTGGFGYDPLFTRIGDCVTFGELRQSEKDAISHRGKALVNLKNALIDAGYLR